MLSIIETTNRGLLKFADTAVLDLKLICINEILGINVGCGISVSSFLSAWLILHNLVVIELYSVLIRVIILGYFRLCCLASCRLIKSELKLNSK
ncbi:unnamed protein product [Blepharisma stoltei]|uniref:Uncharacterized protein n=1 Tax=Blepharisma stoltei TaxID=1481888 RepID=A0AAU9JU03_9CILI|nr:unnamed protein product [Blepharisma stoltei]